MFSFILFRRNINYLLPRLLNIRKPDILPRLINCYDVHAYMPQHQYSASYVYIITVYISLYNILKDKISNLTTYTCVTASTDLSAFSLFEYIHSIQLSLEIQHLILCMIGNCIFLKSIFQKYHPSMSNRLDIDQAQHVSSGTNLFA